MLLLTKILFISSVMLPALATIYCFCAKTSYPRDVLAAIPVMAVGISFSIASAFFYKLLSGPILEIIDIGTWFSIGTFQINLCILVDSLSVVMLFVITSFLS